MNLENQGLVIKAKPTLIHVRKLPKVQKPILSDEIVVAQAEDEPLVIISDQPVDWDYAYTFPFLVEKAGVLCTAIVDSEAVELRAGERVVSSGL